MGQGTPGTGSRGFLLALLLLVAGGAGAWLLGARESSDRSTVPLPAPERQRQAAAEDPRRPSLEEPGTRAPSPGGTESVRPGLLRIHAGILHIRSSTPVPGARIEVVRTNGQSTEVAADENGDARMEVAPGRGLTVIARAPGLVRGAATVKEVLPGQEAAVHVSLERGVPWTGTVRSAVDGSTVAGAVVRILSTSLEDDPTCGTCDRVDPLPPAEVTRTDADGRFGFLAAGDQAWTVTAEAPGFRRTAVEIGPRFGAVDRPPIEVLLEPGASFAGRVVSPVGNPVPGARVFALPRKEFQLDPARPLDGLRRNMVEREDGWFVSRCPEIFRTIRASADAEGRFRIDGLDPNAWYHAYAAAPGWAISRVATDVAGSEERTPPREFRLRRHAALVVRLRGIAAGDSARLRPVLAGEGIDRREPARGPGILRFAALDPGDYRLEIQSDDCVPVQESLSLAEGEERSIGILLDGGASLEGVVLDGRGDAVAEGKVVAHPLDPEGSPLEWEDRREAATDSEGRFKVSGLRPGRHRVRACRKGLRPLETEVEAPAKGLRLTAALFGGFRFRILRPEGAEGSFALRHEIRWETTTLGGTEHFEGGPTGEFSSTGYHGRVRFTGSVEGFAPILRAIDIVPGETVDLGDIPLCREGSLSIWLRDDLGAPAKLLRLGAHIDAVDFHAGASELGPGMFHLEGLPREPVEVRATFGSVTLLARVVTPGDEGPALEWTVDRPGWLEVLVVDAEGRPVPGVVVDVRDGAGRSLWPAVRECGLTGSRGQAGNAAPAGTLSVRLEHEGRVVEAGEVVVRKAEGTKARFVLPRSVK